MFTQKQQLSEKDSKYSFHLESSFELDEAVKCACLSTDEEYIFIFMQTKSVKLPVGEMNEGNFSPENVNCDLAYRKVYVHNGTPYLNSSLCRSNNWLLWKHFKNRIVRWHSQ